MQPVYLLLAATGGYLFGSIPFGLVLTRLAGLGDIREIGSGNIGATNVLRTGRKDLAAATLLLDAGKAGIAAAVFAALLGTTAGLGGLPGGQTLTFTEKRGETSTATITNREPPLTGTTASTAPGPGCIL